MCYCWDLTYHHLLTVAPPIKAFFHYTYNFFLTWSIYCLLLITIYLLNSWKTNLTIYSQFSFLKHSKLFHSYNCYSMGMYIFFFFFKFIYIESWVTEPRLLAAPCWLFPVLLLNQYSLLCVGTVALWLCTELCISLLYIFYINFLHIYK